MKRLLGTLCLGFLATAQADGPTPFYDKVTAQDYSPQSDILIEHYFERNGTDQIWLVSSANPSKRHLLFTHERHAEVLFSDDEKWLVINNHVLSNQSNLLLYRQKEPLKYEQVEDLTKAAWQFFDEQNKPGRHVFDHSYVDALQWANDEPPTLLLYLQGHMDSHNHTGPWCCLYDVAAKKFSVNFAAHNQRVTKLAPE